MLKRLTALAVLAAFAAHAEEEQSGVVVEEGFKPEIHIGAYADIESAYICRGAVWDAHPYSAQEVNGSIGFGQFGRIAAYAWTMSATGSKGTNADMTRYAYNEVDYGIRYFYDWEIDEDIVLKTGVGRQWATNPGFRGGHTVMDWQALQFLQTPWITPYWRVRRLEKPYDAIWWCIGLKHTFAITETLGFTIDGFGDLGDSRHFAHLYGRKPWNPESRYHGGLQALSLVLRLDWQAMDHVTLFGFVGQFCIVSEDARRTVHESTAREAKRDLTYCGVGVSIDF